MQITYFIWWFYIQLTLDFSVGLSAIKLRASGNRFYSSISKGKLNYSLISDSLNKIDSKFAIEGYIANDKTQMAIEQFISDEFSINPTTKNYVGSVDTSILGNLVSDYVHNKSEMMDTYASN